MSTSGIYGFAIQKTPLRVQAVLIYGFLVPKKALKSCNGEYLDPLGSNYATLHNRLRITIKTSAQGSWRNGAANL